jgi:hypothetical protein
VTKPILRIRLHQKGRHKPPHFDPQREFIAYMPNAEGQQMVYVHRIGERDGTFYHSDFDWEPTDVQDGEAIGVGLSHEEALFVRAAFLAAAGLMAETLKSRIDAQVRIQIPR